MLTIFLMAYSTGEAVQLALNKAFYSSRICWGWFAPNCLGVLLEK